MAVCITSVFVKPAANIFLEFGTPEDLFTKEAQKLQRLIQEFHKGIKSVTVEYLSCIILIK